MARRIGFAYACAGVVAVLAIAGIALQFANGGAEGPNGRDYNLAILISGVAYSGLGALVATRRPHNATGWLVLAVGALFVLAGFATGWAIASLDDGTPPGGELAAWLANWLWIPAYASIPTILLQALPNGRFRDRRLGVASCAAIAMVTLAAILSPYPLDDLPRAFGELENPTTVDPLGGVLGAAGAGLLLVCGVASLVRLIVRAHRAEGIERDQLTWVVFGCASTVVLLAAAFAAGRRGDLVFGVAFVPLPVGVAIAVLRHRLWDVDVVINRSLVYGTLAVLAVAGYVGVVAVAGLSLPDRVAGPAAVALVAVALLPLHRRVERAANRLVFGDRDDPAAALGRLGERLGAAGGSDSVLPDAVDTVARALRLRYVAVTLKGEEAPAAAAGTPSTAVAELELTYRGDRVGTLAAAGDSALSAADRRALDAIAGQLAVAAQAVRLTGDLRRSRERLVLAREEERRRLRRDLHDELGPTLAALALDLETARAGDVADLDAALDQAAARARQSVVDVRRLVYDLRPPTLDDLGLDGSLREYVGRVSAPGLAVRLDVSDPLGSLPAAVEVAAYRIVFEAVTNALRHSGARQVDVRLERGRHDLVVTVADDGEGIRPGARPGVGLGSMRERAEELGGSFTTSVPGERGTTITARLPLESA
jgi:signal transduction histidine kinase